MSRSTPSWKGGASAVEKKVQDGGDQPSDRHRHTALQRAASRGGAAELGESGGPVEETFEAMKFAAGRMGTGGGMMIFTGEKKIVVWSAYIAEITGIREDQAVGQDGTRGRAGRRFLQHSRRISSPSGATSWVRSPWSRTSSFRATTIAWRSLRRGARIGKILV